MEQIAEEKTIDFRIYKFDNNLDKFDNLDLLPAKEAVYAIFARINGKPENCRFVGNSLDLRASIKQHFGDGETDECLKEFMQSIKIKTINFELMPGSTEEQRLTKAKQWKLEYRPDCNKELNKTY